MLYSSTNQFWNGHVHSNGRISCPWSVKPKSPFTVTAFNVCFHFCCFFVCRLSISVRTNNDVWLPPQPFPKGMGSRNSRTPLYKNVFCLFANRAVVSCERSPKCQTYISQNSFDSQAIQAAIKKASKRTKKGEYCCKPSKAAVRFPSFRPTHFLWPYVLGQQQQHHLACSRSIQYLLLRPGNAYRFYTHAHVHPLVGCDRVSFSHIPNTTSIIVQRSSCLHASRVENERVRTIEQPFLLLSRTIGTSSRVQCSSSSYRTCWWSCR